MDITSFLSLSGVIHAPEAVTAKAARGVLGEGLAKATGAEPRMVRKKLDTLVPQALGGAPEGVHLFTLQDTAFPRITALCARFGAPVEMGGGLISDIAFLLAAPQTDTVYFKALGIFSQVLRDRERIEALHLTATPEAMYRLLIRAVQESRA